MSTILLLFFAAATCWLVRIEKAGTVLDGSEMIGEETKASPSWQGIAPQQFMDEVRGRNVGVEWRKGAPEEEGHYLIVATKMSVANTNRLDPDHPYWNTDEVLFHIGTIPPVPQSDAE